MYSRRLIVHSYPSLASCADDARHDIRYLFLFAHSFPFSVLLLLLVFFFSYTPPSTSSSAFVSFYNTSHKMWATNNGNTDTFAQLLKNSFTLDDDNGSDAENRDWKRQREMKDSRERREKNMFHGLLWVVGPTEHDDACIRIHVPNDINALSAYNTNTHF